MRLKLEELKKVVDQTKTEERYVDALREEIEKVFGPSIDTNVKLEQLAEGTNYRIDVLERTGRFNDIKFNSSILLKFANNKSVEVRKLVARLLPENFANRFKNDADVRVRHAYARRAPLKEAVRMLTENPRDYELGHIVKQKRLTESGIPQPKIVKEPFDMYGVKLGDAVKQDKGSELSKVWYETMARKFIQDYGTNLEGNWEEVIAKRYCSSIKSTSHVEVDEAKLYKEIMKQISDIDDYKLEKYRIKESVEYHSVPTRSYQEPINIIEDLVESRHTSQEYVRKANKVFSVINMSAPGSLRKYRMTEGRYNEYLIPCKGKIPGNGKLTSLIEEALDKYVKAWNEIQSTNGEPIKIDWSPNPVAPGSITFNAELKL